MTVSFLGSNIIRLPQSGDRHGIAEETLNGWAAMPGLVGSADPYFLSKDHRPHETKRNHHRKREISKLRSWGKDTSNGRCH